MAVNHGLRNEIRHILPSIQDWVSDPMQQLRCEAILFFGLGDYASCKARMELLPEDDCEPLRTLLSKVLGSDRES